MARISLTRSSAAAVVCALLATSGCDLFTSSEQRVARAEQLLAQGDYGRAMIELNNALDEHPDDARAQLALARASLQVNSPEGARRALELAAKGGADARQVAGLRVRLALATGKHEDALQLLESSGASIGEPEAGLLRLRALAALRRFPEAVALGQRLRNEPTVGAEAATVLAECYAQLGNPQDALAILDVAVKSHPDAAEAWLARGRLLQFAGRHDDALDSWHTAAERAGGQLTVLQQLNLATAMLEQQLLQGDGAAARDTLERARRLVPDGAPLVELLAARLDLVDGKYEAATATLQKLVSGEQRLEEARAPLASAQLAAGNLQQALQQAELLAAGAQGRNVAADALRAMTKVSADSEEYALAASAVHAQLGQGALARQTLQKALAKAPGSRRLTAGLAQIETRAGNAAEGEKLARALRESKPDDPVALALLAEACRAQGKYRESEAALTDLQKIAPSLTTVMSLARVRREGKLGNEAAAYGAWVEQHPQDLGIRGAYADSLRLAGDTAGAIAQYEKLVAAAPNSPPALNNLAWVYYLAKDPRALPTAKRAFQAAPGSPIIADTYGWVLVETGATQEGLNVLESAYHDGGFAQADTRYHYAAALARSGARDKARPILETLLAEPVQFDARADAEKLATTLK